MNTYPISVGYFGFSEVMTSPSYWAQEGVNLADAALLVWDAYQADQKVLERFRECNQKGEKADKIPRRFGLWKPAFLNLGLATENLLKAIFLDRGKPVFSAKKLPWPGDGHDQRALAKAAGLMLTEAEENVLGLLQEFVTWAGRYPLPKREADLVEKFAVPGNHWEAAWKMLERLKSELNAPQGTP